MCHRKCFFVESPIGLVYKKIHSCMEINTKEELILQGEDDKILNQLEKRKPGKEQG